MRFTVVEDYKNMLSIYNIYMSHSVIYDFTNQDNVKYHTPKAHPVFNIPLKIKQWSLTMTCGTKVWAHKCNITHQFLVVQL